MKLKHRNNGNYLLFIIILIIIISIYLFNIYCNNINNKLISITKFNLDKFTNKAILGKFDSSVILDKNINELLIINKNKNGEVISIDYDMENTYKLLNIWLDNIYNNIYDLSIEELSYYDKEMSSVSNSFIVSYPIGLASNNLYLNNLGPKIPLKINLLSNITANIRSKVKDYGINSLLVEMYIIIDLKHEIVGGSVEDFSYNYEVLISSKIINGKIPEYYNGVIEKNSRIVS